MRQVGGMTMKQDQYLDIFLVRVYQLRDELAHMGGEMSEERLTDVVLESLTDDNDQIKYNAERDPDFSIDEIEVIMCNMHANRTARGRSSR